MSPPVRPIWAYTYRLVPPQSPERLARIKALLKHEAAEATLREGTWKGRLVVDERVANILVISDSPKLDHEVNQRLEAELRLIDAQFAVTVPLAVGDDAAAVEDEPEPSIVPAPKARAPRVPRKQ